MNGDSVVNCVYVGPLLPQTKEIAAVVYFCREVYYLEAQGNTLCEWHKYVDFTKTEKRWRDFIASWNKEEYYFFIIQAELLPHWKQVLKEYNMLDWVVWQSRAQAVNSNDPNAGPRLTAYILRKV